MVDGSAGKGDSYRPVDRKKWALNYEYIFRKKSKTRPPKKKKGSRKLPWK